MDTNEEITAKILNSDVTSAAAGACFSEVFEALKALKIPVGELPPAFDSTFKFPTANEDFNQMFADCMKFEYIPLDSKEK